MKIEIVSTETRLFSGTSARTSKAYSMVKQEGFAHIEGQKYPVRIEFNLADGAHPWPVGMYQLDESTFYIDRYGSLALGSELKLNAINGMKAVSNA